MQLQVVEGGKPTLTPVDCAGAIILLGRGFVVLVRPLNGSDEWLLPKGHVEQGETALEAAKREATEETGAAGLTVEAEGPVGESEYEDLTHLELKRTKWFLLRAATIQTEKAEQPYGAWTHTRRHIGIFPVVAALAKLTYAEHRNILAGVIGG